MWHGVNSTTRAYRRPLHFARILTRCWDSGLPRRTSEVCGVYATSPARRFAPTTTVFIVSACGGTAFSPAHDLERVVAILHDSPLTPPRTGDLSLPPHLLPNPPILQRFPSIREEWRGEGGGGGGIVDGIRGGCWDLPAGDVVAGAAAGRR